MASNTRPVYERPGMTQPLGDAVSADDLIRIANLRAQPYKLINWHGVKIQVRHTLSPHEYMAVVQNILDMCRAPDGSIAVELLDCATKIMVIGVFASVSVPNDFENIFRIVYDSDLYDVIYEAANKKQIEAIIQSVKLCMDAG